MTRLLAMAKGPLYLLGLLSFVVAIIVPLNPNVIDFCIVLSLGTAVTIFLRATSMKNWQELKTFPSILLLFTMFRIALNISTTRRILLEGDPGHVIESAGQVIAGSNIYIGLVIFIMLTVFQFVVANGAARTAEVAARFTLDSLPGKQMSIDMDLTQRLITEAEAKERREMLGRQIDFSGSMDGASKFVKGDVVLTILFMIVNLVVGLVMGMLIKGLSFQEAISTYTILTVGDGLVNQLTSLLVAISAGIVSSQVKNEEKDNIAQSIIAEITNNPKVLYVVGGTLAVLSIAMPAAAIPLLVVGGGMIYLGYRNQKRDQRRQSTLALQEKASKEHAPKPVTQQVGIVTDIAPITLLVGVFLVPLVTSKMEEKIALMRRSVAQEMGVSFPGIDMRDDASLPRSGYMILIKDTEVAAGEIKMGMLLAVKGSLTSEEIEGIPTKDPVFGVDALWITEDQSARATALGYIVTDALSIISMHLEEMIRRHLHDFIDHQEVQNMIDVVGAKKKVLLEEINEKKIERSVIQKVVQDLLKERIPVKDFPAILEAIIDVKDKEQPDAPTIMARERISKQIYERNKNKEDGQLHVILPGEEIEKAKIYPLYNGNQIELSMAQEHAFITEISKIAERLAIIHVDGVLVVQRPDLRMALARLLQRKNIHMPVMSVNEIPMSGKIKIEMKLGQSGR